VYFSENEKKIYHPPGSDKAFDPLQLDRTLTIRSGGNLNALVAARNAKYAGLGDISQEGRRRAEVDCAEAELALASIARDAFGLPPFPDCLDAQALEYLFHFLEWMEGKGERAGTSPTEPASAP